MRTKVLIALGLVAAFVVGTMASSISTKALAPPEEKSVVASTTAYAPVARQYVAPRTVAVARAEAPREPVAPVEKKNRSWQKEALIVGGSAGAGAAIGAVAGGKKGAAVGAVSGGVAGLIYDVATRNK